jgi:hypothetical protein
MKLTAHHIDIFEIQILFISSPVHCDMKYCPNSDQKDLGIYPELFTKRTVVLLKMGVINEK